MHTYLFHKIHKYKRLSEPDIMFLFYSYSNCI